MYYARDFVGAHRRMSITNVSSRRRVGAAQEMSASRQSIIYIRHSPDEFLRCVTDFCAGVQYARLPRRGLCSHVME